MKTAVLAVLMLGLCSHPWSQPARGSDWKSQEPAGFASRGLRYRIEPSDVIEVLFRFTPEFNQIVTVQPDGFISLQTVGDIKVSGLTVQEATAALVEKYSPTLHQPVITLILKEFSKPFFVVGGEVAKPGRFDLRGDTTLTDAIAIAGGFNFGSKESEVLLFRHVSKGTVEVKKVNTKQILAKSRQEEDIQVQPGDSIYVSLSKLGKFDRFMKASRLGLYFPIPTRP